MKKAGLFVMLFMIPVIALWLYSLPWILSTASESKESTSVLQNLQQAFSQLSTNVSHLWQHREEATSSPATLEDLKRALLKKADPQVSK